MSSVPENEIAYRPARLSEPFEISWYDRFSGAIDRLRLPYWLSICLLVLIGSVISFVITQIQPEPVDMSPIQIYAYFQIIYFLLVLRHLSLYSGRAIDDIKSVIQIEGEKFAEVKHRFMHTPRRIVAIGTLFGIVFAILISAASILNPETAEQFTSVEIRFTAAGLVSEIMLAIIWILNALLIVFTYHKLHMIDIIYTHWTNVNPFRPRELYSLANYSGRSAILWMFPSLPWILLDPGLFSFIIGTLFSILGAVIYILPLLGIHRMLESAKDTLLDRNGMQVQTTIEKMNRSLEAQELQEFSSLDNVLSGLERSRDAIERISTWPWQVESFRRVIAALFLPLVIWLAQYFLGRMLGS